MDKFDYKKALKHLYLPSQKSFSIVEVPPMNFLMIDSHGDPNTSPEFQDMMTTLYSVAYTIKFALKPRGVEYVVPPLEGLWWAENMAEFGLTAKDQWDWTLMVMQPDPVDAEVFEQSCLEAARKKELPLLPRLRFENYAEGLSVQIMYLGAYADEGPTIARMHAFIAENGYTPNGKHHEIYLGDPRRTAPEKLKTVIRQPVRKAD